MRVRVLGALHLRPFAQYAPAAERRGDVIDRTELQERAEHIEEQDLPDDRTQHGRAVHLHHTDNRERGGG